MYAAYARLLASFAITRFELLLHSQGSNADLCTWALKLRDAILEFPDIGENMTGIIKRGIEEDDFLLKEIRLNAISSCILNYTSSTEYFIVDLIQWKLRDKRLLKRALDLKDISIRKFDIADFDNIEDLRDKYINQLSGEFSFGTLWAKKMSNASKLFDIQFDKNSQIIKSTDSIWEERNKLAHLNRIRHLPLKFTGLEGKIIKIEDLEDDDKYLNFCIELIRVMNSNLKLIGDFQIEVKNKWLIK